MTDTETQGRYRVQVGMRIAGELTVNADSKEEAREVAKRMIKHDPFNGTEIMDIHTNNVFEV